MAPYPFRLRGVDKSSGAGILLRRAGGLWGPAQEERLNSWRPWDTSATRSSPLGPAPARRCLRLIVRLSFEPRLWETPARGHENVLGRRKALRRRRPRDGRGTTSHGDRKGKPRTKEQATEGRRQARPLHRGRHEEQAARALRAGPAPRPSSSPRPSAHAIRFGAPSANGLAWGLSPTLSPGRALARTGIPSQTNSIRSPLRRNRTLFSLFFSSDSVSVFMGSTVTTNSYAPSGTPEISAYWPVR